MANRRSFAAEGLPLKSASPVLTVFQTMALTAILAVLAVALGGCSNQAEHVGPEAGATYPARSAAELQKLAADAAEDLQQDEVAAGEGADSETGIQEGADNPDGDQQADSNDGTAGSGSGNSLNAQSASASNGGNSSSGSSGTSASSGSQQGAGNSGASSGNSSAQSSGQGSSQGSGSSSGQTQPGGTSQSSTPRTITVSIEIEARTAHVAQPAAVAGISNAGVILSQRNLTLPENATVRQALDASGIRVNARGAYIVGIGGLSEGDIGPRSGWMYSVDGQFPSASASTFRLSAGDRLVWRYTLDGGADLGAPR